MFAGLKKKLLAALGGLIALAALIGGAWWKGRSSAKKEDAQKAQARHDHEIVQSAQDAQATQTEAAEAAEAVEQQQDSEPAPDTKGRTDFEGTQ